jgi:DNA-binding PadR family transcriptional regulator
MSPRKRIDNTLYIALLSFFIEKPNYGYEVYKYLSSETTLFKIWHLKRSQFYSFLERLFNEQYLSHEIEEGQQYPDRRIFSLTPMGLNILQEWMVTPVQHGREMRQDFLVKLFVLQSYYPNRIKELVQNQTLICQQWKHEQEQQLINESDKFQKLLINYRKMQIQSMIDWLDLI